MPLAAWGSPRILVLAGVNGAGKSSLSGEIIRDLGVDYFNPDEMAQQIRPEIGCTVDNANALAWEEGRRRLESAINSRSNHAFESTLGGHTIPALLIDACRAGINVIVWFVGLASPEQHIARVRARVVAGGHDIPEEMIRKRWDASRRNLIALMPHLADLRVYDNSEEIDPSHGTIPDPRLLLHWRRGRIIAPGSKTLRLTPEWAKPIVAAAWELQQSQQ